MVLLIIISDENDLGLKADGVTPSDNKMLIMTEMQCFKLGRYGSKEQNVNGRKTYQHSQ